MPNRKKEDTPAPAWSAGSEQVLSALGRFIDKFGASFVILVLLLAVVYLMGSPATRDEFVTNLFFDRGQDTRFLKASFALLALDAVLGVRLQRAWAERENRELKRCSDEKAKLQELLNQRGLAHSADHVGVN